MTSRVHVHVSSASCIVRSVALNIDTCGRVYARGVQDVYIYIGCIEERVLLVGF